MILDVQRVAAQLQDAVIRAESPQVLLLIPFQHFWELGINHNPDFTHKVAVHENNSLVRFMSLASPCKIHASWKSIQVMEDARCMHVDVCVHWALECITKCLEIALPQCNR